MKSVFYILPVLFGVLISARSNVVLMGSDLPHASVLGGDFEAFRANWRRPEPSPNWTAKVVKGGGKAGFAEGTMMINGPERATFESVVLDQTEIKSLNVGDVLAWRFAANAEYPCDGRVSLALVFGGRERKGTGRVKVPSGPEEPRVFEGFYTVTAEDAKEGMPRLKFTLESTHHIIVYVQWVDLKLLRGDRAPELAANAVDAGIELSWSGDKKRPVSVYRSAAARNGFEVLEAGVKGNRWIDSSVINGKIYYYAVRQGDAVSHVVPVRKVDSVAPAAPQALHATDGDWTVQLNWKTADRDSAYFKVYRDGTCIAPQVLHTSFEDPLPVKSADNVYAVKAVDFSGNEGPLSKTVSARTRAVRGASFSDLILPMPIHEGLRSDVWGADSVKPRDPENGVEDSFWSYWGGKVVEEGGTYHINVVRWSEGAREGHWAWPGSTVAYAVSDRPDGPFRIVRETAYDNNSGHGHNANIVLLNDGTYALYSLIDWKAMMLTANSISGPWKVLGEMTVNVPENYKNAYRLERNLSGVQCPDGSFLFATKAGAMIRSTKGILGPYEVVSGTVQENETIPEKYRYSNYEDPAFWYDGVQYHMLINAFLDYRAIYLRSPDGVHWTYEDGLAYTPSCTQYEDGTRTFWYKVERPNVLQDQYGRATHLSLAAIDVPKRDDYGNDNHSSKHLIIPLVVYKRIEMLNNEPVTAGTRRIELLVRSEPGFDAQQDIDLASLRFGASEAVNFGGGCKVIDSRKHPDGLLLTFDGTGNGMTDKNFCCKLIGQTRKGKLIVGFSPVCAPAARMRR